MARVRFLAVLVTFLLVVTCNAEGMKQSKAAIDENFVIHLGDSSFDEEVANFKAFIVYFHAPWCKTCDDVSKEVGKAGKELQKLSLDGAGIAMVDGSADYDIVKRFSIQDYPTIKVFRDGKAYDYKGKNNAEGFIAALQEYVSDSWKPPAEHVVSLTEDTFKKFVTGEQATMVEFYAPWCGHCKQLAPEYEKAAAQLKKHGISIGKVDCDAEKSLQQMNQISGYPTLRFYRNGRGIDYYGARSANAIVEYMLKRTGAASKEIEADRKAVSKHVLSTKNDPAIIGFFPDEEHEAMEMYEVLSEELRDNYTFAHVFSSEVGRSFGIKGDYGIAVFQPKHLQSKYEPKVQVLSEFSSDDKPGVAEWIRSASRPLVGYVHENNSAHLYDWKNDQPFLFMYFDVDFSHSGVKETQYWRNRLLEVAKNFKDQKISFAVVEENAAENQLKTMGFSESTSDVFVAILSPEGRFPYHEDFEEDDIIEFVQSFLDGKLKQYLKSEVPPKPNNGPVKIVVGRTFDEIVMDESKDVFIEFYAPWCVHCQRFDPILKKVAKRFSKNKDIVFAKYNAIANDVPGGFNVPGFPTIYFKKKGEKKAVKFEGNRAFDDVVLYMEDNAVSLQKEEQKSDEAEKDEL